MEILIWCVCVGKLMVGLGFYFNVGVLFGLGKECVRVLVKCGVYVILVVRRVSVLEEVKVFIIVEILNVKVEIMLLDLCDMKFVY